MKTIKFYTLGCKVNQYDTQSIRERFLLNGFEEVSNGDKADVYLINTCTVTHGADSDSFNLIRRSRRQNPGAKIIVTGCLVEKDSEALSKGGQTDYLISKRFFTDGISGFRGHTRAFLKIQDGCNNSCSYCKVPLVRGNSRSRPLRDISAEAEALVKNGHKEIVLTGICLGAYGQDLNPGSSLVEVIDDLEKIEGLLRIRLSSIEAGDVKYELAYKMSQSKKLMPHLHIPIQSGDDKILRKMNRSYRREDYLSLILRIKKLVPRVAITTDCLVGFPGEDEVCFMNTLDLVKEIAPLKVHIFPYSKRGGTAAALDSANEIESHVVRDRTARLKDIARECSVAYRKQFLGDVLSVLVEGRSDHGPDFWEGHSDNYIKVVFGPAKNVDLRNRLVEVRLDDMGEYELMGHWRGFLV
jgi:threonylcarbamoyladenosine tRNA methylthiotransferase MtaB